MKRIFVFFSLLSVLLCTFGCSAKTDETTVRVGALKGPTSISLVSLMQQASAGSARQSYDFTLATNAEELVAKLTSHELDIALLPSATAANVAQKTNGAVEAININTLNTLYGVAKDNSLNNFQALAGKTVYMSGKGTTPEYVVEALLHDAGLSDSVKIIFVSEPQEAVSKLTQAPNTSIAILPEPFATAATKMINGAKKVLDIGSIWKSLYNDGSEVVTALSVTDSSFIESHPDAISKYLIDAKDSVDTVLTNPEQAAAQVVAEGILDSESVAEAAIPFCGITSITGEEMKKYTQAFFEILVNYDSASLGGRIPNEDFYYIAESNFN